MGMKLILLTSLTKLLMRHATSSGCSTALVVWATTPGPAQAGSRTYGSVAGYFERMGIGLPLNSPKNPEPPSHPKSPLFREFSPPSGGLREFLGSLWGVVGILGELLGGLGKTL